MAEPRRTPIWAWPVLVGGTLLGIISLFADVVGVGGFQGFGWRQALGASVAFILVLAGAYGIMGRRQAP